MNGDFTVVSGLTMTEIDLVRRTLEIARESLAHGNLPFGCLLANSQGEILLKAENTVNTARDAIAHCEINLVHRFAGTYDHTFLQSCTVFASTEPCPMCSAALFWSGVGKVVYAVSKEGYKLVAGDSHPDFHFPVSSRELLSKGGRMVAVVGPVLEDEGLAFYRVLLNK